VKKNLVLIGMMGVGKSTIGKLLSKKFNIQFEDIDKIIERKLSLSIKEIFETKGEKFFREIEEKMSIEILQEKRIIIALGGGAFLNNLIRKNLKKFSISIWLDLNPKYIFQRIKKNKIRPLLNHAKSEKDVEEIYKKRKAIYSLADFRINCNLKAKYAIVKEITKIYEDV
jgi:shikimate kinase